MAFALKDLAEDPTLLHKLRERTKKVCETCGAEFVGGGCEDCYYGQLGELVEEHPIVSAGIRRS